MLILVYAVLIIILLLVILNLRYPSVSWDTNNIRFEDLLFPDGFIWGVATSSHQVEGYCDNNDWYIWENSIDEVGKPRIKNGQKSGVACDHWNRYREDIELIKELGCNAYRFSIEWSKVEPEKSRWDEEAIDHYQAVCECLLEKGIRPFVTLHHFTNPIWIWEMGGFENEDTVKYFLEYVEKIVTSLKVYVDWWATFNEPVVYAVLGWYLGIFPPGKKNILEATRVLANLLEAHAKAYYVIHGADDFDADGDGVTCNVGIVKSVQIFDPYRRWNLLDWLVFYMLDYYYNQSFIDAFLSGEFKVNVPLSVRYRRRIELLENSLDWVGLNYYTRVLCGLGLFRKEKVILKNTKRLPVTDMGWTVYPQGLYRALLRLRSLGVPIFVTENGIATMDEKLRGEFILQHVDAVREALLDGVDVRGYFYWSLMDNFEWAEGFDKRFGLYYVNYNSLGRELKRGSEIYKKIILNNIMRQKR